MPAIGETLIGRYRLDSVLGSGGMATVYRGRDLRLDRDVAIKVLLPNRVQDKSVSERFDREARAMAAVRHLAIVRIYDVEPADPATGRESFFVMELCEGGSLADAMARTGVVPPDQLIPIIVAIAGGLAELHSRAVVHRDGKPHNILLTNDGAKLGDLGVARDDALDGSALTTTGATVGTLAYVAPEALAGSPSTPASDVYGLGVVTYQALTGRLPRPATNIADLIEARTSPIVRPSIVAPMLGEAFDDPLLAALATDPVDRPGALELATALTSSLGRWSRDRSRLSVPRAPDADATTLLAIPARSPRTGQSSAGRRAPRAAVIATGLLLLGAFAALIALTWMLTGGTTDRPGLGPGGLPVGSLPSVAVSPSVAAAPSVSASPSPLALPSPSPLALPSPSLSPSSSSSPTDPLAAARAAISEVRVVIGGAKGGSGGLTGKETKALNDRVSTVERALAQNDLGAAAKRANDLVARVEELIRKHEVTGQVAGRLLEAAQALRDAILAL